MDNTTTLSEKIAELLNEHSKMLTESQSQRMQKLDARFENLVARGLMETPSFNLSPSSSYPVRAFSK